MLHYFSLVALSVGWQVLISSVDTDEARQLRRQVPYLLAQPPWNNDWALRNNLTVRWFS